MPRLSNILHLYALCALVVIAPLAAIAAMPDFPELTDFAGNYANDKVVLVLKPDGIQKNAYTGTITVGGRAYPCRATYAAATGLTGTFGPPGAEAFPFSVKLEGGGATLVSGASNYSLRRVQVEPGAGPAVPRAGAKLPEFMKRGTRISFRSGDSVRAGVNFIPDPNGSIIIRGQRYRPEVGHGNGGAGFAQLSIVKASDEVVAADVRTFQMVNVVQPVLTTGQTASLIGNADGLGEYWVNPSILAKMHPHPAAEDGATVTRGVFAIGDHKFDSVSIFTSSPRVYTSKTYDMATGMLLFGGEIVLGEEVQVIDPQHGFTAHGDTHVSHRLFAGIRQVEVPWADEAAPRWAAKGGRLEYRGTMKHQIPQEPNLPRIPEIPGAPGVDGFPTAASLQMTEAGEGFVMAEITYVTDLGPGANLPNKMSRCFGSAMFGGLWISPRVVGKLRENQVLDQDAITGYRVSFAGVQGKVATIVEQGPIEVIEYFYDTDSGVRIGTRTTTRASGTLASSTTNLQLVRAP